MEQGGYGSATGKGDLAKGYARITTHAYDLENTPDLGTVRDGVLSGYTVEAGALDYLNTIKVVLRKS